MQKNTISFLSHNSPKDGTHYNQGIKITWQDFDGLKTMLEAEIKKPRLTKNYTHTQKMYLKTPLEIVNNLIVFMNLTQRDFFINNYLNKYLTREPLNRNTYFLLAN